MEGSKVHGKKGDDEGCGCQDNYADDDVNFDESSSKISAKESLEKRRLIDDLLAQRRLERELKDFDYDIDDDDDFDDEED